MHRKALLEALADALPTNSIRFSSKLTAVKTESHGSSSIVVIHMEDGTVIKAKVVLVYCPLYRFCYICLQVALTFPLYSQMCLLFGNSI